MPFREDGLKFSLIVSSGKSVPSVKGLDPVALLFGLAAATAACVFAPDLLARILPDEARYVPSPPPESALWTTISWEPVEVPNPLRPRFVEANPEVPSNPPDDTDNFSFRDQQAAQPEEAAPEADEDTPAIQGEKHPSVKIVPDAEQGQPEPISLLPPGAAAELERATPVGKDEEKADAPESPKDFDEVKNDDGTAVKKVEKPGEDAEPKRPALLLTEDQLLAAQSLAPTSPKPPSTKPRPRPRLGSDLVRGPLLTSEALAPRVGKVAIECRLHPYGAYVQEMLRAIEDQWSQLAQGSRSYLRRDRLPPKITLRFTLGADGRIRNLRRLDSYGESVPADLCRQAIASRSPFGEWSDKMINDFGSTDEVTINFLYR